MQTNISLLTKIYTLLFSLFAMSGSAQFTLIGSATAITTNPNCAFSDTCFALTQNSSNQLGAVWHAQQFDLSQPFDGVFCLYMGDANFGSSCFDDIEDDGADGIAFVLKSQSAANIGGSGGGMGYAGINPSVAIEFDTYPNGAAAGDIVKDHTSLVINGNQANPAVVATNLIPNGSNVEDGNYHTARLVWNPTSFQLSMYFDNVLRFTHIQDLANTVFGGNTIVDWGFTGSTGGCTNLQQICFPSLTPNLNETTICDGDSALISFYDNTLTNYLWQNSLNDTILYWDINSGNPLVDTSFYTSQAGYYYLTATQNGVTTTDSVLVTISTPTVNLGNDTVICTGSTVLFDAGAEATYNWQDGSSNQTYLANDFGTYWVEITNQFGCTATDTVSVNYFPLITYNISDNDTICADSPVTLTCVASGGNPEFSYFWDNGGGLGSSVSVSPTVPTTYTVTIIDQCSTTVAGQVSIEIHPDLNVSLSPDSVAGCPRTPFVFSPTVNHGVPPYNYTWTGAGISNGSGFQGLVNASVTDDYVFTITDACNQSLSESILLYVLDCAIIETYNVFTPNGDGVNDVFYIQNIEQNTNEVFVYNRWGSLVFKAINYQNDWNMEDLSDGVYFYIVKTEHEEKNGNFTVLRNE